MDSNLQIYTQYHTRFGTDSSVIEMSSLTFCFFIQGNAEGNCVHEKNV